MQQLNQTSPCEPANRTNRFRAENQFEVPVRTGPPSRPLWNRRDSCLVQAPLRRTIIDKNTQNSSPFQGPREDPEVDIWYKHQSSKRCCETGATAPDPGVDERALPDPHVLFKKWDGRIVLARAWNKKASLKYQVGRTRCVTLLENH